MKFSGAAWNWNQGENCEMTMEICKFRDDVLKIVPENLMVKLERPKKSSKKHRKSVEEAKSEVLNTSVKKNMLNNQFALLSLL